jgi:hypothetical protein
MGSVNKEGKSFFEIAPREIRDLIYDATFQHEVKRGHVTSNFEAPCLHLRLISRQFKDEYDERTPKRTKLVLCFDAEIVPLRSRHLSTFVPTLATRCTSIELRYLAHKYQLFDGYGERSQNFAAFSVLCMELMMSMTHLRGLEIQLIWDSVSVLEDFATQCRRTVMTNTCVSKTLRGLLSAEFYLSRLASGASNSSGSAIDFKLQYRGLASIGPAGGLDSDVSGIELLEEPAILGFWSDQHNYFLIDEEATRERKMVEIAIQDRKIAIEDMACKRPEQF